MDEMDRTFTQEDVDRIVTERLQRERKGYEKQLEKAMQEAAMTEQDRLEAKLKEREDAVKNGEARLAAAALLKDKGLPMTLVDTLTKADAPLDERVDAIDSLVREHVAQLVTEKLKGGTPKGTATDEDAIAKAFGVKRG